MSSRVAVFDYRRGRRGKGPISGGNFSSISLSHSSHSSVAVVFSDNRSCCGSNGLLNVASFPISGGFSQTGEFRLLHFLGGVSSSVSMYAHGCYEFTWVVCVPLNGTRSFGWVV